jgi:FKBP-type peptidyl-prolyl cis-trans isomerase 2
MTKVKNDNTVKVHYKGLLKDGTVFDSSEGREPLEFKVGSGMVIKGFDEGVKGMSVSETKKIDIPVDDAYGPVMEELIQDVPKSMLPESITPEVGMQLVSTQPDGQQIPIVIRDIKEDSITVDANHQLAGKDLVFEIELVEIS